MEQGVAIRAEMQILDDNSSEAEIIARVLSGQRDDFRHLVDRHKDLVFAMIQRQVGDRGVAEDLAQEVFCRAYQYLKQFRGDSSFATWITRIALNQTNTYFASRRFKEGRRTDSFDAQVHDLGSTDPEGRERMKEILEAFRSGLSELSPKLRDVLVLSAFEQKSYEEVAAILEIPIGTVRSRLNAARLQLRKFLPARNVEVSS